MKALKNSVQRLLSLFGWQLQKIQPPPNSAMLQGLNWLSSQGIECRTIIDVGASDGKWSLECMESFPDSQYVLMEPNPSHSESLDSFVFRHNHSIADKRAVGKQNGKVLFDVKDLWGGAMDPSGASKGSIEVSMVTLDACLSEHGLIGPFLIKLDTHGFEKGILDGADHMLEQTNALVVECYNFKITPEALQFWDFCSYLAEKGFRPVKIVDVLDRKLDGCLWQADLFFVKETWEGFSKIKYQ